MMDLMYKKSWRIILKWQCCLLGFLTLLSCGKGYVPDEDKQEEVAAGRYWAMLKPLNQKVGRYSGWANLSISDNQFWARVKVNGPMTKVMHAQYIHLRGTCPDMQDDTNGDGYLDFVEAYQVAGPILLPLDSNLNSQMKGLNEFPKMMKGNRFYYYSEACNSSRMLEDLKESDTYSEDMMTKLAPGEELNLTRRVIIIYGVNADRKLPPTVRSYDGYPVQDALPIACGEILAGEADDYP
ncbi:MAG: hypothetical protein H0V66_14675 [Bdellovibrionales bacterium]|nr:hypothetical protein [Bdellovibrionales bacterium]